ncbi:hypothetical protein M758_5G142900 [Ceratodon purpureus]|uniref:Uncharacterized protein n=1 Tax=Ceratodon purpureus TaxID=3225 RepID=A0A8T0I1M5_CERPU|nr:hypothetical protein KC19_5G149100 [Ceratodon purpureus]KAG0616807.1 hypothetical protein M758_5G142900 [Ceratodon purpureus]
MQTGSFANNTSMTNTATNRAAAFCSRIDSGHIKASSRAWRIFHLGRQRWSIDNTPVNHGIVSICIRFLHLLSNDLFSCLKPIDACAGIILEKPPSSFNIGYHFYP